jgi:hypothetical protein
MEYLTAKQTIGKLKQGRVTDISESYFSQLVKVGAIPYHTIPGKKRKLYLYDEVKKALDGIRDPSRDAQREVHTKKREANLARNAMENDRKELKAKYAKALSFSEVGEFSSVTEKIQHKQITAQAKEELYQAWNYLHGENGSILDVIEELRILREKGTYENLSTGDMYNIFIKLLIDNLSDGDDYYSLLDEILGGER